MRTTIDIPDALFRRAKQAAARQGGTLREVVVRALEAHLARRAGKPYAFEWRSIEGGPAIPAEVMKSRAAFYEYFGLERKA
jgi:hypothetical protein